MDVAQLIQDFNFCIASLAMHGEPLPEGVDLHPDTLAAIEAHDAGTAFPILKRREEDGQAELGPCLVRLNPAKPAGKFFLIAKL